ncbi:MAG: DUF4167 domain-containing protein [Pseudomonadota bacterium]
MNNKKRHYKNRGGRGRSSGSSHLSINKVYDSNGPGGKVRGTAQTIYEKYQSLARDAHASGDRILAENYLQHGEHYLRIIHTIQEQMNNMYRDHTPQNVPFDDGVLEGPQHDQDSSMQENNSPEGEKSDLNAPFLRRSGARRKPRKDTSENDAVSEDDHHSLDKQISDSPASDDPEATPTVRRRRTPRRRAPKAQDTSQSGDNSDAAID